MTYLLAGASAANAACGAFCTFKTLDPVVQGSIIGGGAALIGTVATVLITGLITAWQAWLQRQERNKDRALQIKKDELMSALRGVREVRFAIAQFSNLSVPIGDILSDFNQAAKNAGGAAPIASIQTISAMRDIAQNAGEVFRELMQLRRPVDAALLADQKAQETLKRLRETRAEISARQYAAFNAANVPPAIIRELSDMEEEVDAAIQAAGREALAAMEKVESLVPSYLEQCTRVQLRLQPLEQELVQAARIDIGVDNHGSRAYIDASSVDIERLMAVVAAPKQSP